MDKLEIRNYINQSYKGAKNMFLISSLGNDSITIIDYNIRFLINFWQKNSLANMPLKLRGYNLRLARLLILLLVYNF